MAVHVFFSISPPFLLLFFLLGNQTYTGDIRQLESYQQLNSYTAAGTASMTLFQEDDGAGNVVGRTTTVVSLTGTGLVGPVFQAHLHRNPCANGNGGPHYRHNPIGEDAVNENWPYLNCNGTTRCDGTATNNWQPRAGNLATGMSIVVHDTPGADGGMGRPYGNGAVILDYFSRGPQLLVLGVIPRACRAVWCTLLS